jgi:PAS domain S-box-containing protein
MKTDLASIVSSLDKASYIVCLINSKETIVAVNAASQTLLGFEPRELRGKWFGTLIVPEDGPIALRGLKQAVHSGSAECFETRVVCKDGSTKTLLWSVTFHPEENLVLFIAQDVTERKASELRLRLSEARARVVIETLPLGVIITDGSGQIEIANPAAEAMLGLPMQKMIGDTLQNVLFPFSGTQTDPKFMSKIAAATAIELQAERRDGTHFPVEITVNEFASMSGINYIITMQDVTDRTEIGALRRQLVSLISHDLAGPLTALQGVLTLIEDGIWGELQEEGLQAIELAASETARLIQLIENLVALTKSTFTSNEMKFQPVLLSELLTSAISSVATAADQKNLTFAIPDFNPRVNADVGRLAGVLVTFLSLAVDVSAGGATIEITAEEAYSRHVSIRIRALSPELREPPRAGKRNAGIAIQQQHNVLGLALARSVIEKHGGNLNLCDEARADFVLTLPIAR